LKVWTHFGLVEGFLGLVFCCRICFELLLH